jgi:hypothetical protein
MLKIMLGGSHELLIGVTDVLVVIIFIMTGGDCDSLGPPPRPPLIALDALFVPLLVATVDAPRPPPGAAFPLHCLKTTLTASSPEVCMVVMSRSSFVVFDCSQPSTCTRVWQVVPDQNADITSASHIYGSS